MTLFALTRPWWGIGRRQLAIDTTGTPVVAIEVPDLRTALVIPTSAITTCVVLGSPAQQKWFSRTGPAREFDQGLSDGRLLASRPQVADLTTTERPTLALLLDPPQTVPPTAFGRQAIDSVSWRAARSGRAQVDVVLCSPVEPDAVARALASVGVVVDDDAELAAVRRFGLARPGTVTEDAVVPRRRRAATLLSLTLGALAVAALVPGLAALRPYVGGLVLLHSLMILAVQRR